MGGQEPLGIALKTVTGSVCALTLSFHLIPAGKVTCWISLWPLGLSLTSAGCCTERELVFFLPDLNKGRK